MSAAPGGRRRIVRADGPDPIDIFVGKRVREGRLHQGLSQNTVAAGLGVSFQAVQKYESAAMRIAASTLFRLCHLLGVAPGYFFEGYVAAPSKAVNKPKKRGKR
jgi:transcriptional regulator with XRE-family HTH domain